MSYATLRKLLSGRDEAFGGIVAATMEGRENAEAYWRHQYRRIDAELHEVCEALDVAYPELQQLPFLVFGKSGLVMVIWE